MNKNVGIREQGRTCEEGVSYVFGDVSACPRASATPPCPAYVTRDIMDTLVEFRLTILLIFKFAGAQTAKCSMMGKLPPKQCKRNRPPPGRMRPARA